MNETLHNIISGEIGAAGPIPFSRFMELCLYHPVHGYYRKDSLPIGKSGDYYTSPCVHRLFGSLVARQIAEIGGRLGGGPFTLVEAGAGRGHLARDIGAWLAAEAPSLHERTTLVIIEPHRPFRDIQYAETRDAFRAVKFADGPGDLAPFTGVFYSNELFDAFPVDILVSGGGRLAQVHVDFGDGSFAELLQPLRPDVAAYLRRYAVDIPPDFRTEVCPAVPAWYGALANRLTAGAILTIDYGYTRAEYLDESHNRGTLMAYHHHRASEDPYVRPGEQDLTAHVDFTTLRTAGEEQGLTAAGYTEQQYFLMGAGFVDEATKLQQTLPQAEFETEIRKAKTLILPGGMGTTFKVLCQAKGVGGEGMRGFAMRDLSKYL